MSYYSRIVNISADFDKVEEEGWKTEEQFYKCGHRDARHAACVIISEAQNEIDELREQLDNKQENHQTQKLRVWWKPQIPCKSFYQEVESLEAGVLLLETLGRYDLFQYDNNIKPDYCNMGGLHVFDPEDTEDSSNGSWVSWCDEETGEEDPVAYLKQRKGQ